MSDPARKLRVFLCHASQDKPIVRELYNRLIAEGWLDPWLDEENLLPGQDWDMEIEKAVETADAVLVCLSNNSVTKEGFIQKEMRLILDVALEKLAESIFVIPLRLEDCVVPRRLRNWQYLDLFPKSRNEQSFHRLVQSLRYRLNQLGNADKPHASGESSAHHHSVIDKIKYQDIKEPLLRAYTVNEIMDITEKLQQIQFPDEESKNSFYKILDDITEKSEEPLTTAYALNEALDVFQKLQSLIYVKSKPETIANVLSRFRDLLLTNMRDPSDSNDDLDEAKNHLTDFNSDSQKPE